MPKFVTDENFKRRIFEGLRARLPDIDLLSANEAGLLHTPDDQILSWAAERGRVVLTHDYDSMIDFAYERLAVGLPMPGVVMVPWTLGVGRAVAELAIVLGAGLPHDLENQVLFVSG
jgi:predicted nuclease of predicted toxin-antitoxin system